MNTQRIARLAVAPAALLLAGLLAGCGGGGGKGPAGIGGPATGAVQFHLKLPAAPPQGQARPALIPQDFQSLVITLKDGDKIISGPTVTTKNVLVQNGGQVQVSSLPLKALTALVEAKADPNGQGAAEAAASETVTPAAGTPATAPTLILQSRIVKLAITTPSVTLFVGGAAFLSATPMDQDGQVVMVDPNTKTIQWSAPGGVTLDVPTGLTVKLTGSAAGSGPISATYTDGTQATGDFVTLTSNAVPITVQAKPTGRPPNIAQYFQQVAIGPTGVGPGNFAILQDIALGSLYTADSGNGSGNPPPNGPNGSQLQKYTQDKTTGALTLDTSFGGTGAVEVPSASSVAVDPADDSVYIASGVDNNGNPNGAILKFSPTGGAISLRPSDLFGTSGITGLAVDAQSNLFVAEAVTTPLNSTQIEVFDRTGKRIARFGGISPGGPPALQAGLPAGLTVDKSDNIYVLVGSSLVKLKPNTANDPSKGYTQDAGFGNGGVTVPLVTPARVAVDTRPGLPTTGNLYVTLPQNNQVEVFDISGSDSGRLPLDVPLNTPTGIAIDNSVGTPTSGYIYIGNKTVPATGDVKVDRAVHVFKPQP